MDGLVAAKSFGCGICNSVSGKQLSVTASFVSCNCPSANARELETRAAFCGTICDAGIGQSERKESVWHDFLLNPTKWCNSKHKRTSRRYKRPEDVLWIDKFYEADSKVETCRKLCKEGELTAACDALALLLQRGCHLDSSLFYRILKRCIAEKDLVLGSRVHVLIVKAGYHTDAFLANHIIQMYASHGRLDEAIHVFTKVAEPDCYMWASIISAHADHGQSTQAIDLYRQMRQSTVKPNSYVFVSVLKACATAKDVATGKEVHADILVSAAEPDIFAGSCLVDMYAKCGSLEDAREVFDSLPQKDVVTWTAMIAGYAQHGFGQEALALYTCMQQEDLTPANQVTFVCLLQACASIGALHEGQQLHAQIQERNFEADLTVGNSLVDMYAKCGSMEQARAVFDRLHTKDVVTWNAMLTGYAHHGLGEEALNLYARMQQECSTPANPVTFVCLLQACASIGALHEGKRLHAQIQEIGMEGNVVVGNCLVDMYAKCGSLEEARRVFDLLPTRNVLTYNALMAGYAEHGLCQEALTLHASMRQDDTTPANIVTFVCLLKACASVKALHQGKQLHEQIQERGLEGDAILGRCLVDMYAKCGSIEDARKLFDSLPKKDVVTWTAMIAGYSQQGLGQEALSLYADMQQDGLTPADCVTFVCLLQACTSVGALHHGKQLHAQTKERGLDGDVVIGSCLVDMYAKCGSLEEAREVFDKLPTRNVVTWTALLYAYAGHSDTHMAMQCFEEMRLEGVKPNSATFVCLLVACSHEGLVDEGQKYFKMMVEDYGIRPEAKHLSCMVDLLGRSGRLDEAEEMLQNMHLEKDVVGWTSLLTACKIYGDMERGRRCFERLTALQPGSATAYVLLGNIYANSGRWKDASEIESLRRSAGAWKKPGKACIELKNKVHEFTVGQERGGISSKLRSTNARLKEEGGHVPQTELVLKTVSQSVKENALCGHAEKLALAYGLLNTPDGTTLRVTKNLRMCNDCHSSTKILSRLEKRQIIVRDAHRVHRFVDGSCSCGDGH